MTLYPWQAAALAKENDKALWCAEAGTGKTHAAHLWLEQKRRHINPTILCPKQIKQSWQAKWPHATVLTPYEVRTAPRISNCTALVIDEADEYASPLFLAKKRSQMATKVYEFVRQHPTVPVLLLTATPIRSTPWNLHTLLTYIGRYQDWKEFREKYFVLEVPRYLTRPAWFPKTGWQRQIQKELEEHAEIALMKDMVDYLPPETHEVITLKSPNYAKNKEWEASKQFVEDHRLEQRSKVARLKKIAHGYRKVAVVAHYREQIDDLRKKLSSERETFVLDGRTKDVESVISAAEDSSECYFIIQAAVGAGFELPSFAVMVFVSQGYSVRNYVQMKARIRRINALKPVKYYYMHGGKCDKAIYKSIEMGKDFVPSEYLQDN